MSTEMGIKKMTILNLAGPLSAELGQYFAKKGIAVFSPGQETDDNWTHILTTGRMDFKEICSKYNTIDKNIKLVSITSVDELQSFVKANGQLILDDVWFQHGFGEFILDKFFQEYGGIALGDSYPVFQERGSFNITNPFNTGEYLDRLVHSAFLDGMSGLSIKTFFDHLVMYLTGLKNKGKLGLPIEVAYGYFQDVFGVQLHFFTQDLNLEDLSLSLSHEISKKAEEYLLNVSVQSCDFFDLTFLREVNKAVITGLWTKSDNIRIENRGMLLSHLSTRAPMTQYPIEGVTSFQANEPILTDLSDRIVLPVDERSESSEDRYQVSGVEDIDNNFIQAVSGEPQDLDGESSLVRGTKDSPEEIRKITGRGENGKEAVTIVKGTKTGEENEKNLISGAGTEQEAPILVKGSRENQEESQTIKGGPLEGKEQTRLIKGTKSDPEERFKISGYQDDTNTESFESVKGAAARAQQALKMKSLQGMKTSDQELPESQRDQIDENQLIGKKEQSPNKNQEKSIDNLDFENATSVLLNDKHIVKGSKEEEVAKQVIAQERAKIQEILQVKSLQSEFPSDLKNKFAEHLKLQNKNLSQATEKDLEDFKKQQIQQVTKNAANSLESRLIGKTSGASSASEDTNRERSAELKMMALAAENENLKSKMKTLLTEVKILKDSKAQMADLHRKAVDTAEAITQSQQSAQLDQLLREQMLEKIKAENGLSGADAKKLVDLMERENQFVQGSKDLETRMKKIQIELSQKEAFYAQEVEKLNRQLKAKDTVIMKSKETVTALFEKKDHEILMLNEKLKEASKLAQANNPQAQQTYVKELEKQVTNHQKMIEIYKEKLSKIPMNKSDDDTAKEESRKLQIMNTQFKNQLEIAKKEIQKFQDKIAQDAEQLMNLKTEKLKLEDSLKKANMAVKKEELATTAPSALESEVKKLKGLCEFYEVQIKEAQNRNREQDAKLQAALKNQKKENIADETGKGRLGQLENNVRKLTQDLTESRNQLAEMKKESSKLKLEKVALQNQLDKFKKAEKSDKAKPALPKKPGTGGKAA